MRFASVALAVPTSVATGTPLKTDPRSSVSFSLGSGFVGTVKFQWSPSATADIWHDVGPALTAQGMRFLDAGGARRVRANTTAYTSGTPLAHVLHDPGGSVSDQEETFQEETLATAASVAAGTPIELEDGQQAIVSISGTFVGTGQLQVCMSKTDEVWHNWGAPFSAAAVRSIPKGVAVRVRINTTAYTSGAIVATLVSGFANEDDIADAVSGSETVTSGALSLFTLVSLLSVTGTVAFTLAAGLFDGQRKICRCTVAASTPAGTLTPIAFGEGTTIAFDAVADQAELVWDGTRWNLAGFTAIAVA